MSFLIGVCFVLIYSSSIDENYFSLEGSIVFF